MRKYPLVPVALAIIVGILLAHHLVFLTTQFWLWALAACAFAVGILLLARYPPRKNIDKQEDNNTNNYLLLFARRAVRLDEQAGAMVTSLS